MYDLEKEIYRILQNSSKIRGYNARLQSEYINLNNKNRQLKVENSKLVFQNACTEISLAKVEADNFAKSEEVKLLKSVINLLAPGYSGKNSRSDSHGRKNDEPEDPVSLRPSSTSSVVGILDRPFQGEADSSSMDSKSNLLPITSANEISVGGAEEMVKLSGPSDKFFLPIQ